MAESFPKHYVGGDISLLPEYQEAGSIYKDAEGKERDLLPFLKEVGMNAMRVRLFVDPVDFIDKNKTDPNACQDLNYIIPLCRQIVDCGMSLMLDFHYSDTWADPSKQWIPARWEGLNDTQLLDSIYSYTKNSLVVLKENGIVPEFIQTGNEISYGFLWTPYGKDDDKSNHVGMDSDEEGWQRFINLLKSAIKACREVFPDAQIVIHNERVEWPEYLEYFYEKLISNELDYDIIGLSYYPYFHGGMDVISKALTALSGKFPKIQIMIVETGYSYKWPLGDKDVEYPLSEDGQNQFAQALVNTLRKFDNATGLFWWWMEYNAYGTNLENWYNAPLFSSQTGKAQKALYTICSFATDYNDIDTIESDSVNSDQWYNLNGMPIMQPSLPGYYIHNGKIVLITR